MDGMLSQEEINALFSGMSSGDSEPTEGTESTTAESTERSEETKRNAYYQQGADGQTGL